MSVRFAAGLLRLWVVISFLWFAVAGAYIFAAYRDASLPDLTNKGLTFDDLVPAYEHCWKNSDGSKKVDRNDFISDEALAQIAECERTADRWLILRNGVLIALAIPIIVLGLGWSFVWAFRGFLPPSKPS
jgi:hypothetical protein